MTRPLLFGICIALSATACASAPQPRPDAPAAAASAATAPAVGCVTSTGSRIPRKANECIGVPGRSYTKDDLDRTGAISVSEALQRLDPAISRAR